MFIEEKVFKSYDTEQPKSTNATITHTHFDFKSSRSLNENYKKVTDVIEKVKNIINEEVRKTETWNNLYENIEILLFTPITNVLVIYGLGGIGKTEAVKSILEELKRKHGIEYVFKQFIDMEYKRDIYRLFNLNVDLKGISIDLEYIVDFIKKSNVDIIVFDDVRVSKRIYPFLGKLIEEGNKKLIFIVNDLEELEKIRKISYNRSKMVYYEIDLDVIGTIVNRIENELGIKIGFIPLNLRMLLSAVEHILIQKYILNKEVDVDKLEDELLMSELKEANNIVKLTEIVGRYLLKKKTYQSYKEFEEDTINILKRFYSETTIRKKMISNIRKVLEQIFLWNVFKSSTTRSYI